MFLPLWGRLWCYMVESVTVGNTLWAAWLDEHRVWQGRGGAYSAGHHSREREEVYWALKVTEGHVCVCDEPLWARLLFPFCLWLCVCVNAYVCHLSACVCVCMCVNVYVCHLSACMYGCVQSLSSRCPWSTTWGGVSLCYKEPALPEFKRGGEQENRLCIACAVTELWNLKLWEFGN